MERKTLEALRAPISPKHAKKLGVTRKLRGADVVALSAARLAPSVVYRSLIAVPSPLLDVDWAVRHFSTRQLGEIVERIKQPVKWLVALKGSPKLSPELFNSLYTQMEHSQRIEALVCLGKQLAVPGNTIQRANPFQLLPPRLDASPDIQFLYAVATDNTIVMHDLLRAHRCPGLPLLLKHALLVACSAGAVDAASRLLQLREFETEYRLHALELGAAACPEAKNEQFIQIMLNLLPNGEWAALFPRLGIPADTFRKATARWASYDLKATLFSLL
jgi:hypothetical protein